MSETDMELCARYTRQHAEDAFAELVRRHLGLVYSAALRQVRSRQLAEEAAQSAFTELARNAARLRPDTILTAWLYQVTRRTAIDVVRREASRQLREQIATETNAMNATAADWTHIEPLLDEAMHASRIRVVPIDYPFAFMTRCSNPAILRCVLARLGNRRTTPAETNNE